MRRLIMWNLMTLDGMFDGVRPWELDWHEYAWGDELERFSLEQADVAAGLVFGRRTYEGMARHWATAEGPIADFMNGVPKYVCSRTLDRVDWANSTLLKGDVGEAVSDLKENGEDGDLFVFGSADLSASLTHHGLFDEYRIGLVPVTLGEGHPLFKPGTERIRLELLQTRPLGARCQLLRYRPII